MLSFKPRPDCLSACASCCASRDQPKPASIVIWDRHARNKVRTRPLAGSSPRGHARQWPLPLRAEFRTDCTDHKLQPVVLGRAGRCSSTQFTAVALNVLHIVIKLNKNNILMSHIDPSQRGLMTNASLRYVLASPGVKNAWTKLRAIGRVLVQPLERLTRSRTAERRLSFA